MAEATESGSEGTRGPSGLTAHVQGGGQAGVGWYLPGHCWACSLHPKCYVSHRKSHGFQLWDV